MQEKMLRISQLYLIFLFGGLFLIGQLDCSRELVVGGVNNEEFSSSSIFAKVQKRQTSVATEGTTSVTTEKTTFVTTEETTFVTTEETTSVTTEEPTEPSTFVTSQEPSSTFVTTEEPSSNFVILDRKPVDSKLWKISSNHEDDDWFYYIEDISNVTSDPVNDYIEKTKIDLDNLAPAIGSWAAFSTNFSYPPFPNEVYPSISFTGAPVISFYVAVKLRYFINGNARLILQNGDDSLIADITATDNDNQVKWNTVVIPIRTKTFQIMLKCTHIEDYPSTEEPQDLILIDSVTVFEAEPETTTMVTRSTTTTESNAESTTTSSYESSSISTSTKGDNNDTNNCQMSNMNTGCLILIPTLFYFIIFAF